MATNEKQFREMLDTYRHFMREGKTECRTCPVQYTCTAWHPEGSWEHDEGINKCDVVGDDEE